MELRISATQLARKAGELLGMVRFRRDTFVIERKGEAVARLVPVVPSGSDTLTDAVRVWCAFGSDPDLADDLERVNDADRPLSNPWA